MTWIVQDFSFGPQVFNNERFVGKYTTKQSFTFTQNSE